MTKKIEIEIKGKKTGKKTMPAIILTNERGFKRPRRKMDDKTYEAVRPNFFKPGYDARRPVGRRLGSRNRTKISDAYTAQLCDVVPAAMREWFGVDREMAVTWADLIAHGIIQQAAAGEVAAAKEVREVTEGKLPEHTTFEGNIDYSAGKSAKQRLTAALMPQKVDKKVEKK